MSIEPGYIIKRFHMVGDVRVIDEVQLNEVSLVSDFTNEMTNPFPYLIDVENCAACQGSHNGLAIQSMKLNGSNSAFVCPSTEKTVRIPADDEKSEMQIATSEVTMINIGRKESRSEELSRSADARIRNVVYRTDDDANTKMNPGPAQEPPSFSDELDDDTDGMGDASQEEDVTTEDELRKELGELPKEARYTLFEILCEEFLPKVTRLNSFARENAILPDASASTENSRQVGGSHYGLKAFQHWDVVVMFGLDYFQGQITKYVMRWRDKNGIEDLEKGAHYLEKYIVSEKEKIEKEQRIDTHQLGLNIPEGVFTRLAEMEQEKNTVDPIDPQEGAS